MKDPETDSSFSPGADLAQARRDQPLLDAAFNRAEEEKGRYLAPVIVYFAGLEAEIRDMPIAARFSREHGPNFDAAVGGRSTINPALTSLNEADYKRAQLLIDLQSARTVALGVIGQIGDLVLDIEATKQD